MSQFNLSTQSLGGWVKGWVVWWEHNIDSKNNASQVTAELWYRNDYTSATYSGQSTFYLTVDGSTDKFLGGATLNPGKDVKVMTKTVTIRHGSDGAKKITISAGGGLTGTSGLSGSSGSQTVTLATIARETTPQVPGTIEAGSTVTIQLPRADKNYHHRLWWRLKGEADSLWEQIGTLHSTECQWTLPKEVCSRITQAVTAEIELDCATYDASDKQIGKEVYVYPKAKVPDSVVPTGALTATAEKGTAPWPCVKGFGQVSYEATGEGVYGSTIVSCTFTFGNKTVSGMSGKTPTLDTAGTFTPTAILRDSRGRTVTVQDEDITVEDYNGPSLDGANAFRSDAEGTENKRGQYCTIEINGRYDSLGGKNQLTRRVRVRRKGGLWAGYDEVEMRTIRPGFEVSMSYEVELSIIDRLGSERTKLVTIPTAKAAFHFLRGVLGGALGKYADKANVLEIAPEWDLMVKEKLLLDWCQPVGSVLTTTENVSPAETLGGEWEMLDKKFRNRSITSGFFTATSSVTVTDAAAIVGDDQVTVRLTLQATGYMGDTDEVLGNIDMAALGMSEGWSIPTVGYSDEANAVYMVLAQGTGKTTHYDVVVRGGGNTAATGATIRLCWTYPVTADLKLDESCDRFLWKRTK